MNQDLQLLQLDVLQQFRVIYGSMRQYFRELEDSCGLPGITELAGRLGIHQSTCSILVEKLTSMGYLVKQKMSQDQRRIGLRLTPAGDQLIAALPGPAEGILPEALATIPQVSLRTLHINLAELIQHMPGKKEIFATTPLAELVQDQQGIRSNADI